MVIYANRINISYRRKCGNKGKGRALIVMLLVLLVCGIAGNRDQQSREMVNADFSASLRKHVVASWSELDASNQLAVAPR
jgi:hypothetical protein